MSYTRHYTETIHYSGQVSYPASQNGGYKSFSGSETVHITIHVDTDPFDKSVSDCNRSLNGLTAAVVATSAAEVESKKESSRRIADSIIRGFFNYVGADISQKIKELSSKCEATLMAMLSHKQSCESKSSQMKTDYERITKRYSKVFDDLDNELVSRVKAMDASTMSFVESSRAVLDKGTDTELLGLATVAANENIGLDTMLACSHIKKQASSLIERMHTFLHGNYVLTNTVRDMLHDEVEGQDISMPVLYMESVDKDSNLDSRVVGPEKDFGLTSEVSSGVRNGFMSPRLKWKEMKTRHLEEINTYINSMIAQDGLDARVVETMREIMKNSTVQTI